MGHNKTSQAERAKLMPAVCFMQTADLEVLTAAARGLVDLNLVARVELAARGLDTDGRWVGFEAAGKALAAPQRAFADRLTVIQAIEDAGPCGSPFIGGTV